ncbi:hypothetical protein HN903_00955 [archaeon]|jgi:hypothetical protein|nr:hypothetical protein [archaeon]MBT7128300.1 hypothetical protein [archaeon]
MVKKGARKKGVKFSHRSVHPKLRSKGAWFRKKRKDNDWGFIPINWKGWVAMILLVGLNVFAANYFRLYELVLDSYLKMGVVFLLSIFIFIEIAKKKTRA